uniref:Uncharacterized protein n=1 Tax=Aureoumbra lagunensis TaxID=44058 RepID=A0A7S3NPG8_9STRA|mmetsp:Transcript_16020/g.21011  ORF Transcript_16020/g.21011 Transcript_16020/m.21011 type:complete len:679 (-) Transcript_16020:67-2103(-)
MEKDVVFRRYHEKVSYPSLLCREPQSLESFWMAGELDLAWQNREQAAKKGIAPFLALPHSVMLPSAVKAQRRVDEMFPRKLIKRRSSFTEGEESRLRELEQKIQKKTNPYLQSQTKLKYVLRRRRPGLHQPNLAKSSGKALLPILERYRIEKKAASVLVSSYRRYRRKRMLLLRFELERNAIKIQAAARAFIARKLVSVWWLNSQRLAVLWQSRLRSGLDLTRAELELREDQLAALAIQKHVRGFLGRCQFLFEEQSQAVNRIQRVWRGSCVRYLTNALWLNKLVTKKMQAQARGYLSRKRSAKHASLLIQKANAISRVYRGYRARKIRAQLLEERETRDLQLLLKELAAQRVYCDDIAQRFQRRINPHIVHTRREHVRDAGHAVSLLEAEYLRLKLDYETCTPRSISSGWHAELKRAVADHRNQITQAKAKALFDTDHGLIGLRLAEETLQFKQNCVDDAETQAQFADNAREAQLQLLWARSSRTQHDALQKIKRQQIADQKRKWQVKLYNPEGKPLKNVDSNPHQANTTTDIDLFADLREDDDGIHGLAARIRLQQWRNQVAQLERLFEPFRKAQHAHLNHTTALSVDPKEEETQLVILDHISHDGSYNQNQEEPQVSPVSLSPKSSSKYRPRRARPVVSRIPWSLLDELDAEKHKFDTQRAYDLAFAQPDEDHHI